MGDRIKCIIMNKATRRKRLFSITENLNHPQGSILTVYSSFYVNQILIVHTNRTDHTPYVSFWVERHLLQGKLKSSALIFSVNSILIINNIHKNSSAKRDIFRNLFKIHVINCTLLLTVQTKQTL